MTSRLKCHSGNCANGLHANRAARSLWSVIALILWLGEWAGAPALAARSVGALRGVVTRPAAAEPSPSSQEDLDNLILPDQSVQNSAGAEPAAFLLPDLRTLPPSDLEIRRLSGGRRILRLANTIWNGGQGPLELAGEFNRFTQRTTVNQRLYAADGTMREHFVGEFAWHFGHTHWHFEDFAMYQLWSVTPAAELYRVVSSSAKLSYCLVDTDVVNSDYQGFDLRRRYRGCGRKLQGLSVGWGDTYDSFLDGQSLDIAGLADGIYAIVSTANPWANLVEASYSNNTALVYLNIEDNRVIVVPSPEFNEKRCQGNGKC